MTTEEMVVDVSQDWVMACDVQQGFMQAPRTVSDSLDCSACCRQVRASAVIATILYRLRTIASHS
jgi:hypothetical protein